jgi:hypothetical protein
MNGKGVMGKWNWERKGNKTKKYASTISAITRWVQEPWVMIEREGWGQKKDLGLLGLGVSLERIAIARMRSEGRWHTEGQKVGARGESWVDLAARITSGRRSLGGAWCRVWFFVGG